MTLIGTGAVLAADLPAAMPAKAPAFAPVPAYDWTGFYVGGHVGAAWDSREGTVFSTTTSATGAISTKASGVVGGGQLGFNYALAPNWLIGLEADISGADLKSSPFSQAAIVQVQHENKIDLFGTARGRLGYVWNNWLFYGTGGLAWADEQLVRTQVAGTVGAAGPGVTESGSATATGWTAGGGLEWGFTPSWTARVEYLHLDLGTASITFPVAQQRYDARATVDEVRFGVNYLFNLGGPVTGRY